MNTPFSSETLAAVEVCLAGASALLYSEPAVPAVAAQVAACQFASAPFAADNARAARGLALMDGWCAEAVRAAGLAVDEAGSVPAEAAVAEVAAVLAEDASFAERVGELRREWLRLFVGAGAPEASCLESFYVEPNSHMFGRTALTARAAYRRHGLVPERVGREPDDHLALMLGFLARLVQEERAAREAGDEAAADEAAVEQEAFLTEHVLPWLAAWRYAVEKHARTDYFRGLGDFVFGLCACYAERFGIRYDEAAQAFKKRLG
ncbi:TorD/DmsD family molecular chaperone [Adlercreutzia caecimuris]|uniref:TorD/DmsD family molecular chaperone n=1 Tax=Adlercreutzia caecimuris TaxID=671266 RepID=UPI00256FD9C5|nr:molecular chaperone TorD family protein [Adlercreutzia caecimuris]